jgi:hypothetical protein
MRLRLLAGAIAMLLAFDATAAPVRAATVKAQPSHNTNTITLTVPAHYNVHSYRGTPDLGLTLAIVQAGGGSADFDSAFLLRTLAGKNVWKELWKLKHLYGKQKVLTFMQTFNFAVRDLVTLLTINHVALPARPRITPVDGRAITIAIYRDGVMPTGKYDCGYMMEHLMTHGLHMVLMREIDMAPGQGPTNNANFHIILTRMIADLRDMYTKNGKTE